MTARSFHFITLFPELVTHYFQFGVLSRAQKSDILRFSAVHLRQFAVDRHGTVDGRPYGGGEGMVLRPEPLAQAVESVRGDRPIKIILPSPRGKIWNAETAQTMAKENCDLVFVCPRFSGVDQRFLDQFAVAEYSLGDFVVSGGELPAIMFADSIARNIAGVLGDSESADCDSFSAGMDHQLEYPLFTRPESIWQRDVPEVLKSGDHKAIAEWRKEQSRNLTAERRPDLIQANN